MAGRTGAVSLTASRKTSDFLFLLGLSASSCLQLSLAGVPAGVPSCCCVVGVARSAVALVLHPWVEAAALRCAAAARGTEHLPLVLVASLPWFAALIVVVVVSLSCCLCWGVRRLIGDD